MMMATNKSTPHRSHTDKPILPKLVLVTLTSLLVIGWCYLRTADRVGVRAPSTKDGVHFQVQNGTPHEIDYLHRSHYLEMIDLQEDDQLTANLSTTLNGTGQEQNAILHRRVKRGVLDLASMIKCVTGCNPFMYKDYGCYCGFQGDGYPVDGIDRCCFMHDHCYSRADCHQALVYFKSYKWACMGYGRAKCGYVSSSLCALQLCECDRKFAKCLTRYRCPHTKASCDIGKNLIIGK